MKKIFELSKFFKLFNLTASPEDHEALAACRAMHSYMKKMDVDLMNVFDAFEKKIRDETEKGAHDSGGGAKQKPTDAEMCNDLLDCFGDMEAWEKTLFLGIKKWVNLGTKPLSEKQHAVIQTLYEQYVLCGDL